jgi:predicted secreted Zn-dependent protease
MRHASRGIGTSLRWALVLALIGASVIPVLAGVTATDTKRSHKVDGTTAKALISNMQRHPFAGDHGGAFANIRPRYTLFVDTAERGNQCRPTDVDVRINFTITLPEATQRARMSKSVRNAWDNFVGFARRHENTHRSSYIGCAKAFVSAAMRERGESCFAVESAIRRMFDRAKRECEVKQMSFDRAQRGAVTRLTLFNMAGY